MMDDLGPLINRDERVDILERQKSLEEEIKEKYDIFEREKI